MERISKEELNNLNLKYQAAIASSNIDEVTIYDKPYKIRIWLFKIARYLWRLSGMPIVSHTNIINNSETKDITITYSTIGNNNADIGFLCIEGNVTFNNSIIR